MTYLLWFLFFQPPAMAVNEGVYALPMNCSELLPDPSGFIDFLRSVGQGGITQNSGLSKRIFKILAMRERIAKSGKEPNPIDTLIRKVLCYYREQKEPLRSIAFDDPVFIKYLQASFSEFELKVSDAVFQVEFEVQQKKAFEKRLEANRNAIESLNRQAEAEALQSYNRIAESAKKKVRLP